MEHVAGEFRKAAHSQMAATTQRTIRSVMIMVMIVVMIRVIIMVMVLVFGVGGGDGGDVM